MERRTLMAAVEDGFDHAFKDPLWKDIALDDSFRSLYLHKAVQKLDRIRQNGPACHIYPGAVHTRLAHSLGVYHVGRMIMQRLVSTGAEGLDVTGIRSFLAACLLHDIGHFPYAHSLKELSVREHEELACQLIEDDRSLYEAIEETGAHAGMVMAIIDGGRPADDQCLVYRGILSGALDPDKLDYLNRDAFFAGVPYGLQDTGYIISSMRLHEGRIALERDAVSSLEHLLFSKYLMYRNVYWHKGVRSATCMIKKALLEGLRDGVLSFDDLYFIDDFDFDRLPDRHPDYGPFSLIERVADSQLLSRTWSRPYRPGGRLETACADLFDRLDVEQSLYRRLSRRYPQLRPYEVVIDIQEPISFESDTMILVDGQARPFTEVSTIFSSDVARQFTSSLRTIALYAPAYVDGDLAGGIVEDGLED